MFSNSYEYICMNRKLEKYVLICFFFSCFFVLFTTQHNLSTLDVFVREEKKKDSMDSILRYQTDPEADLKGEGPRGPLPLKFCGIYIGRKEFFYLTTHSTHYIYGYMASAIYIETYN